LKEQKVIQIVMQTITIMVLSELNFDLNFFDIPPVFYQSHQRIHIRDFAINIKLYRNDRTTIN